MSTNEEEQDAGATYGSERSADQAEGNALTEAAALAEGAADAPRTLPSIIVDPGLSELAREAEASATPAPTNGAHVAAAPPAAPAAATPAVESAQELPAAAAETTAEAPETDQRFSDEDADRFAANFRPSWEPAAPIHASSDSAARTSLPALGPAAVVVAEPELPAGSLAGADQRKRGLMMAGAAVVGFFVLVALAFSMSSRSMPDVPAAKSSAQPVSAAAAAVPSTTSANPAPVEPSTTASHEAAPAELRAGPPPAVVEPEPTAPAADDVAAKAPAAEAAPIEEKTEAAPPATPEQPAAPEATPVAIVPPTPAASVPSAPPEVRVRISAAPASAHITLDGTPVSNPFDARAPKGEHHRVQVEAPGHSPRDITLNFERDQKLSVKLERTRAPVVARAPAKPSAPPKPSAPAQVASAPLTITPRPAAPPALTITPKPATPPAPPKPSAGKGAGFVNESPY